LNVIRKESPGTNQKLIFIPFFPSLSSFPLFQHKFNYLFFPPFSVHLYLPASSSLRNSMCFSFLHTSLPTPSKCYTPLFPIDCVFQKIKRCTSRCNLREEKLFCFLEHVLVNQPCSYLGFRTGY